MSIKLMSAIFDTEFHDLEYEKDGEKRKAKASTAKLVLLAIADHANDYGESAYPGYDRLEIKTALSRQGLSDTLDALKYNGLLLVDDKRSRLGTNDYTINIRSLPAIAKELPDIIDNRVKPLDSTESSHLTQQSQATGLESSVNHQLTVKPHTKRKTAKKGDGVDAMLLTPDAQAEMLRITEILHAFERDLKRSDDLAGNETWRSFAKNFVIPQMDKGHDYQVYLDWFRGDIDRMKWAWKETPENIKARWLMAWADQPALPGIEVVPASEVPAPAPAPAYVPNPRLKQKNLAAFQRLESQG